MPALPTQRLRVSAVKVFSLFHPATFSETAQNTDYRSGQGVNHKTAEQGNRRIDRGKHENHHHYQHSHKWHFIVEVDIFKTVVGNVAHHHQAGEHDNR